jgi:quercetin dioxygenase-like cupin family protein
VKSWNVRELPVRAHHPEVLVTTPEGRAIALDLPGGERLQEHQVHEHGWLVVVDGEIEVVDDAGGSTVGTAGFFAHFDPNEPREIRARSEARILLLLTPWPGPGHPSEHHGARGHDRHDGAGGNDRHDETVEDSFPASDPPAASSGVGGQ